MSLPYFFIEQLNNEPQLLLPEETSKHCIQVLRMQQGEQLLLTDGKGTLVTATIINADRKHCVVKIDAKKTAPAPEKKITVAISLLKNASRFEWFLEKATEIGITEIIPLLCKRTEKQYFRTERMQQIVVSAMLQSKQAWLPLLHEPQQFENAITQTAYTTKLIAHCEQEKKFTLNDIAQSPETIMFIGPEGDFTKDEITSALTNNFQPVTLGDTRLRTETAGIVAVTILKNFTKKIKV